MKIIILAAGKGERLMPLTKNTPKPLLDMGNGNTLLEEQILSIKESGMFDEIVLVIGYLAEQVEAKIKMHICNGIGIETVFNPFYEVSNNLMSLWLAKSYMDDDFMVTNGDNIFTSDVFSQLLGDNNNGIFLSLNVKERYDDDDMKVILENGCVARVSKEIENVQAHAESPGLVLIHGEKYRDIFKEHLEEIVRNREYLNKYWLEVFNHMSDKGVPVYPWEFDGASKWQEVDFHIDAERAKELLSIKATRTYCR